jgi:hypothetical protein
LANHPSAEVARVVIARLLEDDADDREASYLAVMSGIK